MTHLLLIRHGIAEEPRSGLRDCDRALTPEGWARTRAAMAGLVARGFVPERGVSSPYVRAVETLLCLREAASEALSLKGSVWEQGTWEGLEPGGSRGSAEAWLMAQFSGPQAGGTLALVSHQPFLSLLIHHLTGAQVDMKKASCAVLRWDGGRFELTQHLSPAVLRGEA